MGFHASRLHTTRAQLATALALGKLLVPVDTRLLLGLMRNIEPRQRFVATVDAALKPAIKNGWFEDTDEPFWRVNCTAIFDSPTLAQPVHDRGDDTVPVGPREFAYGQDTCRGVAHEARRLAHHEVAGSVGTDTWSRA